jgi:hypothetical protein
LNVGERVLYHGKEYVIVWNYGNGCLEIRQDDYYKIQLVHISEIRPVQGRAG